MALCENIKYNREKCMLSQEKLAEMIGVDQTTVARFETGERIPNMINGVKLAVILGTTCEKLVNGGEESGGKSKTV